MKEQCSSSLCVSVLAAGFLFFVGGSSVYAQNVDTAGADKTVNEDLTLAPMDSKCRIDCEKIEGRITKIRCKYITEKATKNQRVTFIWLSPTSTRDNRIHNAVLAAYSASVYDERYLAGRGTGEWHISVDDEERSCQTVFVLDKKGNVSAFSEGLSGNDTEDEVVREKANASAQPREPLHQEKSVEEKLETPPVQEAVEEIKPEIPALLEPDKVIKLQEPRADDRVPDETQNPLVNTCTAEKLTTEVVRKDLNEAMLRIKTGREFVELRMGRQTFDASIMLHDSKGSSYTAIRYALPDAVTPSTVLVTACNGKVLMSPHINGYEKIGSDKLFGFDERVNTAICNTIPSAVSETQKPLIYKVTGIEEEAIRLEELSIDQSVALKLGEEKYREYFKKVSTNMSVSLFMENIYLNNYFARLPEEERAFCKALYEEKEFDELVSIFSDINP